MGSDLVRSYGNVRMRLEKDEKEVLKQAREGVELLQPRYSIMLIRELATP
jgi:hypothetical protein